MTSQSVLRWAMLTTGVLAVVFSVVGRRVGLLEFRPGGSSFDSNVRPIFLVVFIIGLLLAVRWELAGGIVAGFAAAGIVAFATEQLIAPHAALTIAAYAVPAVLWVLLDVRELPLGRAALGVGAALIVAGVGFVLGHEAYDRVWGPTHPESTVDPPSTALVTWAWVGSTSATSAEIRAKLADEHDVAAVRVAEDPGPPGGPVVVVEGESLGVGIVRFRVDGLDPARRYRYVIEVDGVAESEPTGWFRTFPPAGSPFTVAFGACARVGSNGAVFDAIRELDPAAYLIVGDFHYGDNVADELDRYHEVLDITLTQPAQTALYRSTPIAYVWDDHDFGNDNSGADSVARAAAMTSYRQYVPSYELAGPDSPVYQAFTIGDVRFVMTDARAGRDRSSLPDVDGKTMLGSDQKEWLKQELVDGARSHDLVVWVNPVPWVADAEPGADHWGGYSVERREIADHIADHDISNLLMVSGDAHMVAIDDGTNTNYSNEPGPAFPLLHAAALDRPGSIKGGPYSEGARAGGGQFGTIDVIPEADGGVVVVLRAHDWRGDVLLEHTFRTD